MVNVFLSRERLMGAKKIVLKIGSNTIIDENGCFNYELGCNLAKQISEYGAQKQFIIVSSGAIALGRNHNWQHLTEDILNRQCYASVGQNKLMNSYSECFEKYNKNIAQYLLTNNDINNKKRNSILKYQMDLLAKNNVTAIINENDAVSTEEITFGDNDILSAHISNLIDADLLILLSNVDGLYKDMETKELISRIDDVSIAQKYVTQTKSELGTGGMLSKCIAAEIASNSETKTIIANGKEKNIIERLLSGEHIGTLFDLVSL